MENSDNSKTKVCTKQMNKNSVTSINSSDDISANYLIDNKDKDLKESHENKLERGCHTKNNSKRNQDCCSCKVCRNQCDHINFNKWPAFCAVARKILNLKMKKKIEVKFHKFSYIGCLTLEMEESKYQGEKFNCKGRTEKIKGDGWEPIFLQESHQESKTNENHHMHVLKY